MIGTISKHILRPLSRNIAGLRTAALILGLTMFFAVPASAAEREWGVNRGIEQISDSVYRWGSDNQYGAYIVGSNGIAVVDGHYCGSGTVDWIKAEIGKRHAQPIRYIILSHDHQDHNCNSQAFSDTALVIGHRNIVPHLVREERDSAVPQVTFDSELDLDLGGVKLKLMYLGDSHSDNLIQVHIPEEKVLIAIDMAKGRSLFPDYRDTNIHSALRILRELALLEDVDIVLPGHGPTTDQQNFIDHRMYMQALHDEVLRLMVEGMGLAEMKETISLPEFADYARYDEWLDDNVVTMWDFLYRYREPNERITPEEATACREDVNACRTSAIVND